jgi:hypothetical protein
MNSLVDVASRPEPGRERRKYDLFVGSPSPVEPARARAKNKKSGKYEPFNGSRFPTRAGQSVENMTFLLDHLLLLLRIYRAGQRATT